MGADPGDAAEKDDDQRRNRPDDDLDAPRVHEVRLPARAPVGRSIPPGHAESREDRRYDDREHDHDGIEQDFALGVADGPGRLQLRAATARKLTEHQQRQEDEGDLGGRRDRASCFPVFDGTSSGASGVAVPGGPR